MVWIQILIAFGIFVVAYINYRSGQELARIGRAQLESDKRSIFEVASAEVVLLAMDLQREAYSLMDEAADFEMEFPDDHEVFAGFVVEADQLYKGVGQCTFDYFKPHGPEGPEEITRLTTTLRQLKAIAVRLEKRLPDLRQRITEMHMQQQLDSLDDSGWS